MTRKRGATCEQPGVGAARLLEPTASGPRAHSAFLFERLALVYLHIHKYHSNTNHVCWRGVLLARRSRAAGGMLSDARGPTPGPARWLPRAGPARRRQFISPNCKLTLEHGSFLCDKAQPVRFQYVPAPLLGGTCAYVVSQGRCALSPVESAETHPSRGRTWQQQACPAPHSP